VRKRTGTGTSRKLRAAPWRILALVVATVTALMELASISCVGLRKRWSCGSRPHGVGSRTSRPCSHPFSVCDHHGCRSRLFFYFTICDSHRHSRPFFVCRRRNKPVSTCPAPRLLPAGLWGQSAIPDLRCVCGDLGRRDDCDRFLRPSRGAF
jgi:hypothetical protein